MNDNWPETRAVIRKNGWADTLIGLGFRFVGLMAFIGAFIGGIYYPTPAWVLLGVAGFAMVLV